MTKGISGKLDHCYGLGCVCGPTGDEVIHHELNEQGLGLAQWKPPGLLFQLESPYAISFYGTLCLLASRGIPKVRRHAVSTREGMQPSRRRAQGTSAILKSVFDLTYSITSSRSGRGDTLRPLQSIYNHSCKTAAADHPTVRGAALPTRKNPAQPHESHLMKLVTLVELG